MFSKIRLDIYFDIFSRATLNETFTAKHDGVLPRTPLVRPKSEIYTPKRDDEPTVLKKGGYEGVF